MLYVLLTRRIKEIIKLQKNIDNKIEIPPGGRKRKGSGWGNVDLGFSAMGDSAGVEEERV